MADNCPTCDQGAWGGQIVTLDHAATDAVTFAVVCPGCGTVYASEEAREQMESSVTRP